MATQITSDVRTQLQERLLPFRTRAWRIVSVDSLLWMFAGLLTLMAIAMWIDTIWALPANVRWCVSRAGTLLGFAIGIGAILWRRGLLSDEYLARRIDHAQKTGGEILTGLQLAQRPIQPSGELSRSMAAMATERSSRLTADIDPSRVFPRDALRRASWFFGSVFVGGWLLYFIVPQVVGHQIQRFAFPYADIPPYTGVVIDLEVEQTRLLYGQDVRINAQVTHGSLRSGDRSQMMLISVTQEGSESVLPMLSRGGDQWQTVLTRVREPLTVYARSGDSVSRRSQIDVIMTPQILPPTVTITPPAYTGRSSYRGALPKQGIQGLVGTKIQWQVASNRQLSSGNVSLTDADGKREPMELKPAPELEPLGSVVVGEMFITKAADFEIRVTDVDGIESMDSIQGTIKVIPDQRPIVRITQPKPMSLATPDIELPVTVEAEDDYGITSLTLFRSINGSPASPVEADVNGEARQQVTWELPLNQYRVSPGDEIRLFARAEDNDPDAPKGAESPVTVIRIIAIEEFQEMLLRRRGVESMQAKYQQARRHFEQIANALRELEAAQEQLMADPDSAEAAENLAQKIADAQKQAADAAQAIEKLSQQAMPIDIDQSLAEQLSEMAEMAENMGQQLQQMKSPDDQSQSPLSKADQERVAEMKRQAQMQQSQLNESAIEPMATMQKLMPLVIAEQRFTQLVEQQRGLAVRIDAQKHAASDDDPQAHRRIAELESEQQQLKQSLSELLDDIEHHANQLDDSPELQKMKQTALEFAQALRDSGADSMMASAQKNLLDNQTAAAAEDASRAADILESFLSQCNSMGNSACKNCEAAFQPSGCKMGNSIQQMLNMMGMKPGSSGSRVGGNPGNSMGWGAGGGYAQRFDGPQNVGMYGAIDMPADQPRQGNGGQSDGSVATNQTMLNPGAAAGVADATIENQAGGQAASSVPSQYRSRVAEYYRTLVETMGSVENE